MKAEDIACWNCGMPFADMPLPLSRWAKCKQCRADLHVCRQCRFYDTSKSNSCSEPLAEKVTDKKRANVCDYFEPALRAFSEQDQTKAEASKEKLNALFGIDSDTGGGGYEGNLSEEEASREKLNELFGLDKED